MSVDEPSPRRKPRRFLWVLVGAAAFGVLATASGFIFAASQETHDSFCSSCHTQPESTFYRRSIASQAVDLASFHTEQKVRCIDCHSGPGVLGRMEAELLGARNAAAWYTHTAVQPAPLTFPIGDANCLKCHQDVTQRGYVPKQSVTIGGFGGRGREEQGRSNHWHEFLARWQAASPTAATCTSCHPGHSTEGTAQTGFEITQATRNQCDACHQVLREGGEGRGR